MREIRLYYKAFNRDDLTHVHFSTFTEYVTFLEAFRYSAFPFKNYRINENKILVGFSSAYELSLLRNVVYAADVEIDDDTQAILRAWFYHVNGIYEQSGMVVMSATPDLWANFLPLASFSQFHIKRCNRIIGIGKYDAIEQSYGDTQPLRFLPQFESINSYSAVFLLNFNVAQRIIGSGSVSKTQLFYIPLRTIYNVVHDHNDDMDVMPIMEKAAAVIGCIKAVGGTTGTAGAQLEANAVKMWILPNEAIGEGTIGVSQIICASPFPKAGGSTEIVFNNVFSVQPKHFIKTFALSLSSLLPDDFTNLMPAYEVGVGVPYNALTLPRLCGFAGESVYFHYVLTTSNVDVYVEQGKQTQDITAGYEMAITFDEATESSLVSSAKNLGKIAGVLGAALKGYAKGGVVGAAVGGGTAAAIGLLSSIGEHAPTASNSSGDAAVTYGSETEQVRNPYCLMLTPSTGNENARAYFKGCEFDVFRNDFDNIQALTHLGSVNQTEERAGTFIQSDGFHVEGLNKEAEDYIRSEFSRGVWLYSL